MKNMCKAFESLFQRRILEKIYLCSTHKYLMDTMHKRKNYMYGIFARRHNEFSYDFVMGMENGFKRSQIQVLEHCPTKLTFFGRDQYR